MGTANDRQIAEVLQRKGSACLEELFASKKQMKPDKPLTPKEREVVRLLADCDLNMAEVGRVMFYHTNTVRYYVMRIQEKTGLNPARFHDLVALLELLKEQSEDT